jgi:hypothetical protein
MYCISKDTFNLRRLPYIVWSVGENTDHGVLLLWNPAKAENFLQVFAKQREWQAGYSINQIVSGGGLHAATSTFPSLY